jgi:hypothetical protein
MVVRMIASAAVMALLSSGAAMGQDKPDFTGTWRMDMTRSESAAQSADASPKTPVTVIIVQTPQDVTVETQRDGEQQRVTYVFGEPEQPPQPVGTSGSTDVSVEPSHVDWKDGALITTTVYRVNKMPVKQRQTRHLSADGREMVVETHLELQHGYEATHPEYKAATVVKDVFTRVSQ